MNSFWGLVKKDLTLSTMWFFTWLVGLICLVAVSFGLQNLIDEPLTVFGFLVMIIFFQVFLAPVLIYCHLRLEGKNQLWLYNPNGAVRLLLSKLTASLLYQLISQILLTGYGVFLYHFLDSKAIVLNDVPLTGTILIFNLYGLFLTAYTSAALMLLWTVFHSLKACSSALRRFRWIICFLLGAGWYMIEGYGLATLLKPLDRLWYFTVYGDFQFHYKKSIGWSLEMKTIHLSYLTLPVMLVLAAVFLFLASKLLQRKVEV
ncbi:hypothetical protein C6371_10590 [Bacillus atrophaeus]|uniref:hypothetical protein n=1 Tax=Bacillus atrophaeus TaxID=1452 RepID=UPI000D052E1A|nr:hypothetical protein [Bacillus atrophaeus]PSA92477.1 hypothetical protein C6371_10590 [Bacillus atrophaeus]